MQWNTSFRKRCHIFSSYMEEAAIDKVTSIKCHMVLRDFEDVFREIPGLVPKRGIDFSIDFIPGEAPLSKTP
jgi:hypothetical protein